MVAQYTQDYNIVGRDQGDPFHANRLLNGQGTFTDREDASSTTVPLTSGTLYLTYFTAKKDFVSNNVAIFSGGTAAATTTTVLVGLYEVDGNNNLTLIESTVNDTTLLAAANTKYTKAWQMAQGINKGQRYALGVLVAATTMPTTVGFVGSAAVFADAPQMAGSVASQSSLPASITAATVVNSGTLIFGEILP